MSEPSPEPVSELLVRLGLTRFDDLTRHFSHETLARAVGYLDGGIGEPDVHVGDDQLTATCLAYGTSAAAYRTSLRVRSRGEDLSVETTCSCPVYSQCKHGAALCLSMRAEGARSARGPDLPAQPGVPPWRRELDAVLGDLSSLAAPEREPQPLALELLWSNPVRSRYRVSDPRLQLRPMRMGARGRWVKSGVGWRDVPHLAAERRFDVAHVVALEALAETLRAANTWWDSSQPPAFVDFGPRLVPLLRQALDAGITLLSSHGVGGLDVVDELLEVVADAVVVGEGTSVTVGISHDGRLWSGPDVDLVGSPAHSVVLHHDDGRVSLAPLQRRLGYGVARHVEHETSVVVPHGVDDALEPALRGLLRLLPVRSSDASVVVPEPVPPRLRLTVTWRTAEAAALRWEWAYGETSVGLEAADPLRDRVAERELLARLPHAPDVARTEVVGVDVLHLALLELPVWRDCDDVDVVEVDAPTFREAEETPEIRIDVVGDATDGPDGDASPDHTDWLDLEIVVTVEGEPIPLAMVLAALTLGHEHVVLPSGLFVRTDHPAFAQLGDVVRAAAELHERDSEGVRVARGDLGLWAQLAELGIVDAQASEWVGRAQALRDLVAIPRPEPTGVVSTLRSYQLDGFHWLAFLWQHGLGGVLADDMGLGKTLQVLALVAHTRASSTAPFLVVAPTSVVGAWAGEARRHTPDLRVTTVTATAAKRAESIAELAARSDVVVVSYTLQRLETEQYESVEWAGLVLDEAHHVKNHQSKAYSSVRRVVIPFRLAVTGTPFENRLMELWSLLSIVTPGLYPRPASFNEHVAKPVEKNGDTAALRRFTRRIRPFVLRRTKELVAADLPPKQEQVLEVELGPRHRKLYDAHLARERQRILGLVDDFDRNRVAILAALTTLRQLALDPALVDADHDTIGSAKIDVLVEHLREVTAEGHRALVFSTFTGYLGRVRARLDAEGIETAYLDGRTRDRATVIERFRTGDAPVFLISLKAGGVGLTLTEADYVFVLDPWWNPAAEAQAVDRAHRIGQTSTVMVYRMVSTGTIEEKVVELKDRKAELFRRVVDGDGSSAQAITAADVRALFE